MLKRIMIALALLSLGVGVPSAFAQHGHGHHGHDSHSAHGHDMMHDGHETHGVHFGIHLPSDAELQEWGFSDRLIEELRDLEERYEREFKNLEADFERAEQELESLHDTEQVRESTMHAAIDRYFEAKADLLKLQATAAVEARDVMGEENFRRIFEAHQGN